MSFKLLQLRVLFNGVLRKVGLDISPSPQSSSTSLHRGRTCDAPLMGTSACHLLIRSVVKAFTLTAPSNRRSATMCDISTTTRHMDVQMSACFGTT